MTVRIGLTFDEQTNKRFLALAELSNKKPTTLASEIIKNYMATRASDIERVLQVKADYENRIATLRVDLDGEDGTVTEYKSSLERNDGYGEAQNL